MHRVLWHFCSGMHTNQYFDVSLGFSLFYFFSLPFFPLASCFTAFLLRHAQKSKLRDSFGQELKWARSLGFLVSLIFFSPFLFLLFLSFCYSDWPATGLASSSKICEKASSRQSIFTMEKLIVVVGKFAPSFSLKFLSIFVDISGSIEPITLIWVSLERSFPLAEVEHRWCQFWSKVMTSKVEQRPRLVTCRLRPVEESMG